MKRLLLLIGTVASVTAVSASAHAGYIVVNGGFETGDFYGWNVNDSSQGTAVTGAFDGYSPHSGDYFAALGAIRLPGSISQVLNTTAGTSYTLDYFLASDGASPNEFKVIWGNTILFDQVNIPAQGYIEYTFQVTAPSASTNLTLFEQSDNGFLSLDDISVNPATVPEPSSMIPLGIGLVTLAGSVYRSKHEQ